MNNNVNGLLLWVLGATGVLFLYTAVTGYTPTSILQSYAVPGTAKVKIGDMSANQPAAISPSKLASQGERIGQEALTFTDTLNSNGMASALGGGGGGGGGR